MTQNYSKSDTDHCDHFIEHFFICNCIRCADLSSDLAQLSSSGCGRARGREAPVLWEAERLRAWVRRE